MYKHRVPFFYPAYSFWLTFTQTTACSFSAMRVKIIAEDKFIYIGAAILIHCVILLCNYHRRPDGKTRTRICISQGDMFYPVHCSSNGLGVISLLPLTACLNTRGTFN